jgi:hypothetical protein
MADPPNGPENWRTGPLYTFAEAGRLAHVSTGTVRNWLLGYKDDVGRAIPPLIHNLRMTQRWFPSFSLLR